MFTRDGTEEAHIALAIGEASRVSLERNIDVSSG